MKALFKNPILRFAIDFTLVAIASIILAGPKGIIYAIGFAIVYFLMKVFVAIFRGHF